MNHMSENEFREALKTLGISQRQFAADIRTDITAVNRWAKGRVPVPGAAEAYLRLRVSVSNRESGV